jgi:hypothetical protein
MKPEDFPAAGDERRTGKLQHVAVFLKCALQTDRISRCFRLGATTPALRCGKQDARPVRALETHSTVAFTLRIGDTDGLDAVAAAEAGHLGRSSLYHATHVDAAFGELGERLAQLREGFRVERSAKMTQPENERGTGEPEFRQAM